MKITKSKRRYTLRHTTTKSPAQLDEEIAEALRDAENAKFHEEIKQLDPRSQELVLRVQEIAALKDALEGGGLRLDHGRDGFIHARGKTYGVKDVLKEHGFRYDGRSKEWTRRYAPEARAGKIDYLSLYADLIKALR